MNRTVLLRSARLRQCRRNITSEIHEKNICEENVCVSEQFQNKFKIPLARIDKQRQSIPEDIFNVLCNSPVSGGLVSKRAQKQNLSKPLPNVWERILSYKASYLEKSVLLNKEVADQIAAAVAVHTRGDRDTLFIDGEGGLCLIGAAIQKMDIFNEVNIVEKDMNLSALHQYAKDNYLDPDTVIHNLNLHKMMAESLSAKTFYESALVNITPATGSFTEDVPSYSMVATVSHSFLKYITHRLLFREHPFSEFYACRPEFFFIMPSRTFFHICMGLSDPDPCREKISEDEMKFKLDGVIKRDTFNLYNNVMFQTFFDFCLVEVLPRSAYFPWKQSSSSIETRPLAKKKFDRIYQENINNLMMVYARPKKLEDISVDSPKYFSHFLFHLMKNKNKFVIVLMEQWGSGWGLLAIDLGYTVLTMVKDLSVEEMITLYQLMIQLPNFHQSNFVSEAEFHDELALEEDVDEDELENFKREFWKNINQRHQ